MVGGKRIGPAEIESVLSAHPRIVDCAAVGVPHEIKGEAIWCFVVLRDAREPVEDELRSRVGDSLGRAFTPERVLAVSSVPRTRNAKIVRRALREAVTGTASGDLSSLENPEALEELRGLAAAPRRRDRGRSDAR